MIRRGAEKMKRFTRLASTVVLAVAVTMPLVASAGDRSVKVLGWGAKSGPLKSFGVNSEAALRSAIAQINAAGGVKLGFALPH